MSIFGRGGDPYETRNIDREQAALGGVAAEMAVKPKTRGHGDDLEAPSPYLTWKRKPSEDGHLPGVEATYYDRPAIKEPVWIATVPAYFYTGGVAGACAVLGAVAGARGGLDKLSRSCRWVSVAGDAMGTFFLVVDLGRPERFLNMLRVFRPTSPMSVGSWILAAATGVSGVAALTADRGGVLGRVGTLAEVASAALGLPLAGYTAVLVSNTAVPAWQGGRRTLPLVFMGSAVAGAASLLELLDLDDDEAGVVRLYGVLGAAGELAAGEVFTREVGRVEKAAEPYHEGRSGWLWKAAKLATGSSLALRLLPGRSRSKRVASGVLGTVGALALRVAVFEAGKASALEPRATFRQQREGYGAVEVTGEAAVTGAGRRAVG